MTQVMHFLGVVIVLGPKALFSKDQLEEGVVGQQSLGMDPI